MALGVCYLDKCGRPEWGNAVLYLNQPFYETAHDLVGCGLAGALLTKILTMGYDGNALIGADQNGILLTELDDLESRLGQLAQLDELRSVVRRARQESRALVFWGDMFPELDKELRHSVPPPKCDECGQLHKSPYWDVCDCGHFRDQGTPGA